MGGTMLSDLLTNIVQKLDFIDSHFWDTSLSQQMALLFHGMFRLSENIGDRTSLLFSKALHNELRDCSFSFRQ